MSCKIQVRRGSAANMPVLADGEPGLQTDTGKLYVGNGVVNLSVAMGAELNVARTALNAAIADKAAANHTHTAAEVGARPSTWLPSKADVGLGNVDNTADSQKSVNYANTSGNTNAVGGRAAGTVLSEIDNLKTSVANGKSLIASAISDKGVSTGSTTEFGQMANNIRAIKSDNDWTAVEDFEVWYKRDPVNVSKYRYVIISGSQSSSSSASNLPATFIDVQNGQAFKFNMLYMTPISVPSQGGDIPVYKNGTYYTATKTLAASGANMSCFGLY